MKKMIFTLVSLLMMAVQTNAMTYEQARNEALFLTDKMAYELNLNDAQYEAAYEINLDYLMSVTGYHDVNGLCWERRNADLRYILYSWQWDAFCAATYFFRPLFWDGGYWHFGIYARYPRRDYFYFGRPHFYASYRGGHSWRMNGDRSFYEHRRDMFRPGHVSRDHHVGMRNGWDRGDYRGAPHGSSSTRVTGGRDRGSRDTHGNDGWRNGRDTHTGGTHTGGTHNGGSRNEGTHSGGTHTGGTHTGGTHSGSNGGYHGTNNGGSHGSGSYSGGERRGGNNPGSSTGVSTGGRHSGGSYSGGHTGGSTPNSGHTGGSFSGGQRGGSSSGGTHSGGGFSGGQRGGSSSGGTHTGGGRSGGNTRSGGGSHGGGNSRR